MTILNEKDSLLLVIDMQEKLLKAMFNKNIVEKNAITLAKAATVLSIPTIVTEQYPAGLGSTVPPVLLSLPADAYYYEKFAFSALDNADITEKIRTLRKRQIIILGIETHICVSQTANALVEAGYNVNVILDACGSRNESDYIAGLERIKDNGGHVITTEIAIFEWLKSSKHAAFKEIQRLIK